MRTLREPVATMNVILNADRGREVTSGERSFSPACLTQICTRPSRLHRQIYHRAIHAIHEVSSKSVTRAATTPIPTEHEANSIKEIYEILELVFP
jgi:hypothetical protein